MMGTNEGLEKARAATRCSRTRQGSPGTDARSGTPQRSRHGWRGRSTAGSIEPNRPAAIPSRRTTTGQGRPVYQMQRHTARMAVYAQAVTATDSVAP